MLIDDIRLEATAMRSAVWGYMMQQQVGCNFMQAPYISALGAKQRLFPERLLGALFPSVNSKRL